MKKQNVEELEKKIEKRRRAREKKGKQKMKVSGAGVKRLQKIISNY
jgi:hypothetical protein